MWVDLKFKKIHKIFNKAFKQYIYFFLMSSGNQHINNMYNKYSNESDSRCVSMRWEGTEMKQIYRQKQQYWMSEIIQNLFKKTTHAIQAGVPLLRKFANSVHEEWCRLIMKPVQNCSLYILVRVKSLTL